MTYWMNFLYIDSDGDGRHTDMSRAADSDEVTKAEFESYRALEVAEGRAVFTLDLHEDGDLIDTICLDRAGFRKVTGQSPESDEYYRAIDDAYWANARVEYEAVRKAA